MSERPYVPAWRRSRVDRPVPVWAYRLGWRSCDRIFVSRDRLGSCSLALIDRRRHSRMIKGARRSEPVEIWKLRVELSQAEQVMA